MIGVPNGAIKLCSAAAPVKRQVLPYSTFQISDLTVNDIYAPNNDDSNFSTSVFSHLADFKSDEIIIGGDFNLVLDVEKDKKGGLARTHKKSLEVINSASESLDLIDAWRVLNPDSSRFTWRQKKPEIHCRLDFFLINQCTFCNIINAEILAGYKTDHSMITLQIILHSNTRGRGLLLPSTAKNTQQNEETCIGCSQMSSATSANDSSMNDT